MKMCVFNIKLELTLEIVYVFYSNQYLPTNLPNADSVTKNDRRKSVIKIKKIKEKKNKNNFFVIHVHIGACILVLVYPSRVLVDQFQFYF